MNDIQLVTLSRELLAVLGMHTLLSCGLVILTALLLRWRAGISATYRHRVLQTAMAVLLATLVVPLLPLLPGTSDSNEDESWQWRY